MTAVLVVAGLVAFAIALACLGIDRTNPPPPEPPDDDWGDEDDPDTQPGPLDQTYHQLEAIYHAPAAERRQP